VAVLHAAQAEIPRRYSSLGSRLLIAVLCYLQPLRRSFARYRTRLFFERLAPGNPPHLAVPGGRSAARIADTAWWNERCGDRVVWLQRVMQRLAERRWGRTLVTPWADADLEVYCHAWTALRISTAQEEHGGGKRLLRIRFQLNATRFSKLVLGVILASCVGVFRFNPLAAAIGLGLTATLSLAVWWRGRRLARSVAAAFDEVARELGMVPCTAAPDIALAATARAAVPPQFADASLNNGYKSHPLVTQCPAELD
jgi:hypothetical protein